eukprot:15128602-Heterocapsa_arctica.AAC.1
MVRTDTIDENFTAAHAIGDKVRAALKANGLGFHKDDYADMVITLGHELQPSGLGKRPARAKFWSAAGAIEELLRCRRV